MWIITGDKHHGEPLLYDAARFLLKRLAQKAGVKKRINPHSFRHARASYLANHMTERQMEQYLGWTPGSKMPKIYVHLSGRDTDAALLRIHGLEAPETKKGPILSPTLCPRCQQRNDPTVRFCAKCGLPLTIQAALEIENEREQADDVMSKLLEDGKVREFLLRKLRALALLDRKEELQVSVHP